MTKGLSAKIQTSYARHEFLFVSMCIFVVILNIIFLQSMALGLSFGLFLLLALGAIIGRNVFPTYRASIQILLGVFLTIWYISALGALLYYFSTLKTQIIVLFIALSSFASLLFCRHREHVLEKGNNILHTSTKADATTEQQPSPIQWGLLALHIFSIIKAFEILFRHATQEAVRTPWSIVPISFWLFTAIIIATLILLFFLIKNNAPKKQLMYFALLPTSLTVLLFLSLPITLYPLGFGFDPYIHQATERVIAENGIITPKTPYYIGQYALVVILAKLFAVPIEILDRLLLPLLVSLFLVPVLFLILNKTSIPDRRLALITTFLLFLVPFSTLSMTTPQGLVNLLSIFVIFGCFFLVHKPSAKSRPIWWILLFLTFTAILIHPLIGIPISLFVLSMGILLFINRQRLKYVSLVILALLATILTPALFFAGRLFHILPQSTNSSPLPSLTAILSNIPLPTIPNKFALLDDFIALFAHNLPWLLIGGALIGLISLYLTQHNKTFLIFPVAAVIAFLNTILLSVFVSFDFLISYERDVFSQRFVELGLYFLLPFFLYACFLFLKKILQQQLWCRVFFLGVGTLFIMTSLYTSYPRHDRYITGRNFNTSQHDFAAVNWIEQDAKNKKYIVLANQMVSAAAMTRFGFTRYFSTQHGALYFYPIPTSSPLYTYYLKMVYEAPQRQTVFQAMDLMGVDLAYFVLNDYWTDFKKLVPKAEREAESLHRIGEEKISIFRYEKKSSNSVGQ